MGTAVLILCLAVELAAQSVVGPALAAGEADALMARAAARVFSSRQVGLIGFDCQVHPDWRWIFLSANPGTPVAGDDPRVVLLEPVRILLHVDMAKGATVEWRPPSTATPRDKQTQEMLEKMHQATEQTLTGFFQFWTPFVDGSAIPASARDLAVRQLAQGYEARGQEEGTEMRESFAADLTLEQFEVTMHGTTVRTQPAYSPGTGGLLLVSGFAARILPTAGKGAEQAVHATVEYKPVDGMPVPARVTMEAAGEGSFQATLDGCRVSRTGENRK